MVLRSFLILLTHYHILIKQRFLFYSNCQGLAPGPILGPYPSATGPCRRDRAQALKARNFESFTARLLSIKGERPGLTHGASAPGPAHILINLSYIMHLLFRILYILLNMLSI